MHLFWSWVWPITPMIVEWTKHSGVGNGEPPSRTILVVGGQRHVGRVVESLLSDLVVVVSGE